MQGYIRATYGDLVAVFGEPTTAIDGYKVTLEWRLTFDWVGGKNVVTIYDWKETSLYDAELPSPAEFLESTKTTPYSWHVGGHSSSANDLVHMAMDTLRVPA